MTDERPYHTGEWIVPRSGSLAGVHLEILSCKPVLRNPGTKKARRDVMMELRQKDLRTWVVVDDGEFDIVAKEAVVSNGQRKRQQEAGYARRGPREVPSSAAETSDAGYRIPRAFESTRHLKRNQEIVRRVNGCRDNQRTKVIEALAEAHGISQSTVRHVARYFKTPERA